MAEITVAEVDQAEAALAEAKAKYHGSDKKDGKAEFQQAKRDVVQLRQQFRMQEEAAGRRTGMVGGDAVKEV